MAINPIIIKKQKKDHEQVNPESVGKQLLHGMLNNGDGSQESQQALENAKVIGRIANAMAQHDVLRVNGQQPDSHYQIADYLMHGGRVNIDFGDDLTDKQKHQFWQALIGDADIFTRMTSSHDETKDSQGKPTEYKYGEAGGVANFARNSFRWMGDKITGKNPRDEHTRAKNFGVNVALGGHNQIIQKEEAETVHSQANGEFGHIFIFRGDGSIQLGLEGSKPGKTSQITGQLHLAAEPGKLSGVGVQKYQGFRKENAVPFTVEGNNGKPHKLDVFTVNIDKNNFNAVCDTMQNSHVPDDVFSKQPQGARNYHNEGKIEETIQAAKQWQEQKHPTKAKPATAEKKQKHSKNESYKSILFKQKGNKAAKEGNNGLDVKSLKQEDQDKSQKAEKPQDKQPEPGQSQDKAKEHEAEQGLEEKEENIKRPSFKT